MADITPRPLRTKADSVQKIVGYAGTGVMLVAISVMVPNVERPDYLPLFLLQAAFVLVSAVVYGLLVKEPALVQKMHQKSLEMGIREDEVEKDDSPEAGGKERVADRSMRLSSAMLLAATFFYYMSYNAMTTNISRYADIFYGMAGGSYAIINIVTIVGALASYVPLANLSLKVGRKKVALASSVVMVSCPLVLWLVPGFSPVLYLVILLMGVSLGYVAWRLGSTSRSALAVAYDAGLPTAVHDILMQFNVSDGVNNLFGAQLVRVDSPVWSMSWELWFSLTLPLAIWCISRIRRTGLAVVATFIAVLVSYWTGYFPLRLCLMFWLGVMVARRFDKFKAVKLSMLAELALLVASVGVIELSLVWHPGGVLEALKSTAMNAACLVVVVVAIADGFTRRALSAAPMVFLGKVSYSLYLTHAMVIGALVALLPRLGIVDPLTIAAVSLPASMLVSVVFWRIIEVPSMNLSRSLASSGPRDAVR